MQVIFKINDGTAKKIIDILPDSKLGENREAVQMLLGLPEKLSCKLVLERTEQELDDNLTFQQADIQKNDKIILFPLNTPNANEVLLDSPDNNSENQDQETSVEKTKTQEISNFSNSKNWQKALITGGLVGIFGLVGLFYVNIQQQRAIVNQLEEERIAQRQQEADRERQLELERERQLEIEKQLELEREQQLETERQLKAEQEKRLELERQQQTQRQKQQVESRETRTTNATVSGTPGTKNIRSGPGTVYGVVGTINTGTRVQITSQTRDSGNYLWYKIYHPSSRTQGWMAAQLINVD